MKVCLETAPLCGYYSNCSSSHSGVNSTAQTKRCLRKIYLLMQMQTLEHKQMNNTINISRNIFRNQIY